MREISEVECLAIKKNYPIGYKFLGKVISVRPFGIFVRENQTQAIDWGLIDIGHYYLCPAGCKALPLNFSQCLFKGADIYCIVVYYRELNRQIGLCWLGN
ncbi:MAG: hypothetical protein AAFO95_10890 [Cyanobacteria bacterium J06600_6]